LGSVLPSRSFIAVFGGERFDAIRPSPEQSG